MCTLSLDSCTNYLPEQGFNESEGSAEMPHYDVRTFIIMERKLIR